MRQSVPRSLRLAAEWIARHDAKAAAAIETFDSCCSSTWDAARPGVITLAWSRPCPATVAPPERVLAETGDCFEGLTIVVDVGRDAVVSIDALRR